MAITEAALTSGTDVTSPSSSTTASISPTADSLVTVFVMNYRAAGSPNTPTVSGASMTWDQVATTAFGASSEMRITKFRAMASSPGSGALTIDFGGQTQTTVFWSIEEFAGVHTGGTNGSVAIRQFKTGTGNTTVPFCQFDGPVKSNSGCVTGSGHVAASATPNTGFTEIHDLTSGGRGLETQWSATPQWFCAVTLPGTGQWGFIGVELRDAADANNDSVIPVVASVSSSKTSNTNTDITVTFSSDGPSTPNPSNAPSVGDLYIAVATIACFTIGGTPAVATPSNFTPGQLSRATSGVEHGIITFYKVMDGTETSIALAGTPNLATDGMTGKVVRIAAGTFDPTLISSTTPAQTAANANFSVGGVTTDRDNALVLYFHDAARATVTFNTGPFEMMEFWDFGSDPGDATMSDMQAIIQSPAGATGSKTITHGGGASAGGGVCYAIQPPVSTARHSSLPITGVG